MLPKVFLVGFAKSFPLANISDVHASAHNLMNAGVHRFEGRFNNVKASTGLGLGIAGVDGVPFLISGCCA